MYRRLVYRNLSDREMASATRDRIGDVKPIRVPPRVAAKMLSVHYDTLHDLITKGLFTVIAPHGRGMGKRIYLMTDEVEKFAVTGSELAVRELRLQKGRLKKGR